MAKTDAETRAGWTLSSKDSMVQRNSWERFLRPPEGGDAIAMRHLVADTEVLDLNSTYTYLLMAADFADTTVVADRDGDLCGLVTGYLPLRRRNAAGQLHVVARAAGSWGAEPRNAHRRRGAPRYRSGHRAGRNSVVVRLQHHARVGIEHHPVPSIEHLPGVQLGREPIGRSLSRSSATPGVSGGADDSLVRRGRLRLA